LTINWEALVALCALLSLVSMALAVYVRMMLSSALLDFEHRFFERLNGKYIKSELCVTKHDAIERRLEQLEEVQRPGIRRAGPSGGMATRG
jgi:hypothetical protein